MLSFLKRKSPLSSAPRNKANIANKINNTALPFTPKPKTSVLSVLNSATSSLNDPTGIRRNSTASVETSASNPGSRAGSFASPTQANLIQQRMNQPLNVKGQEEKERANANAKNLANHTARIKQWTRNNRVATMKRQERPVNYGVLAGLPHSSNVPPSAVSNAAMNWSAVTPPPFIPRKKPGSLRSRRSSRRNNRTRNNRRH